MGFYRQLTVSLIVFLVLFYSPVLLPPTEARTSKTCLTYEEARYDRNKAVAYAKEYWNQDKNINGQDLNSIGGDCAHFISCCIGNPPQRYPDNTNLSGGLSLYNQLNFAYGIVMSRDLKTYLVETSEQDRILKLGVCQEKLTNLPYPLNESGEKQIQAAFTKLEIGDYVHIKWTKGTDHSMLYAGNNRMFGHNDKTNQSLSGYLRSQPVEYKPAIIYFVHIFDDPLNDPEARYVNFFTQKFTINAVVKNKANSGSIPVRTGPGSDYEVTDWIKQPFQGKILSHPRSLDGRVYYLVHYNTKRGWILEDNLDWEGEPDKVDLRKIILPSYLRADWHDFRFAYWWTSFQKPTINRFSWRVKMFFRNWWNSIK